MKMTIGLGQIYPKLGNVPANLEKHLDYIEDATAQNVDLIIFPEMSLTGYQVMDMVPELAIRASADDPVFGQMLDASHKTDIMFGFVQEDARNRFYIAAAYLSGGKTVHIHHKVYLPTYTMFDDGRYFDEGQHIRAFDTRFGRMGMLICEDFWHMSAPYVLWMDGADILLLQSCSPSRGISTQRDDVRRPCSAIEMPRDGLQLCSKSISAPNGSVLDVECACQTKSSGLLYCHRFDMGGSAIFLHNALSTSDRRLLQKAQAQDES
ncbi:MAG: nitrilase-related carbon-nitrogen hydrolase [Chloroflexota bacterium]